MPKRLNPNLAKIHRSYIVDEVASLYGVHKNTVRHWVKAGLEVNDSMRPMLILGKALRVFLRERNQKAKRPCQAGELYCLKCRSPQMPAERMAEYFPMNDSRGRLIAMCPSCESLMNRFVTKCQLQDFSQILSITIARE